MRSLLTWPAALLAVLFCGITLQQWQLVRLHRQFSGQAAALAASQQQVADLTTQLGTANAARQLAANQPQLGRLAGNTAFWRENERRLMLSSYAGFLAQANLPADRLARLQDVLVERAEAVLDAKDIAEQAGIVNGTLEMQRAIVVATADLDREVAELLGPASPVRTQELATLTAQDEAVAAAPAPVENDSAYAPPAYAYAPAAVTAAPAYAVLESPAAYYPAEGVFYGNRRENRFRERPQGGREIFAVPIAAGTARPPVEPPSVRRPAKTAPAH